MGVSGKELNERELMSESEAGKRLLHRLILKVGKYENVLAAPKFQNSDPAPQELSLKGDCQILCMLVCSSVVPTDRRSVRAFGAAEIVTQLYTSITSGSPGLRAGEELVT